MWFTDGSSYIIEGKRVTGAAMVDQEQTIWASSLSDGTSAQRAELIALTQALQLAEKKKVNIYTESIYLCHCPCPWCHLQAKRATNFSRKRH